MSAEDCIAQMTANFIAATVSQINICPQEQNSGLRKICKLWTMLHHQQLWAGSEYLERKAIPLVMIQDIKTKLCMLCVPKKRLDARLCATISSDNCTQSGQRLHIRGICGNKFECIYGL